MPRGRKVNSNGEKSKQLLREKAIELFSTRGYYETKISDIVKAANVTQPTFYLYFESKDALFFDLNEQFQNHLFQLFEGNFYDKISFQTVIFNIFKYFSENHLLTKIGLYQSTEAYFVKEKLVVKFEEILSNEELDLLEYRDVHIASQCLVASIERLTLALLLTNKKTSEQLVDDIMSIYFNKNELLLTK